MQMPPVRRRNRSPERRSPRRVRPSVRRPGENDSGCEMDGWMEDGASNCGPVDRLTERERESDGEGSSIPGMKITEMRSVVAHCYYARYAKSRATSLGDRARLPSVTPAPALS